jgi:outer membrane protein assembly factor BamB
VKLEGGDPWTFEHPLACRPVVAGGVVVGVGANEMFGLDALTGKLLWSRKAGGCPRGAGDDGKITLVSTRPINGSGGIVVAIDRDGQVVRQIEDQADIGVPAMIDGFLFLRGTRSTSAYDRARRRGGTG